uniref:Right handed beta helix domain-containing protein n=1 Tax=Amphimedon queenslandica TaxID=400682 RepID=A0A1X7UWU5_AMPQE
MSLLLVVVLLFFSSSCSVSSGQYYVSDNCSSVTQSPCNPLSVYAGNMSQYNNTIFYFIGTSVINFTVTMDSVQSITLHGLEQSPTINCSMCYNELHHYSLTLTNVTVTATNDYSFIKFWMDHGVESRSTIVIQDTQFHNNNTELIGNWRNEIISLSTGLEIKSSIVTVENRLVFKNNTGVVGGGMAINGSSVVALSPSANLEFIDNHATYKGGGMHIDGNSDFQFIQGSNSIPLTLKNNTAGVAGNDIYGFIFSFNYFNMTNSKVNVSSNPVRFFFCDPDSNGTSQNHEQYEQQVFSGQPLQYNVTLFVSTSNTGVFTPRDGTVLIKIDQVSMAYAYITDDCSLIEYIPDKLTYTRHEIMIEVINYPYKVQSHFILNECPIGFSVNSSGACDCSVSRENVTCDVDSQNITHNGLLWIGTYGISTPFNANETNPNACIINEDCLLYCSPNPVTFQLNDTDTQCVDNRVQRMCGSCKEGYSLLMGSNKCGQCHNNYMMIAWIALFAVMGVLLVVLLIALNLTVSVGTLNGLLFYANIVKLYEPVFSRKGALPVLSQVISWINLDFGFEICFYNGMDSYAKQWLQFAFPLYLWIIIIIIIQLCKRYVRTIVIVLHKREVTLHCTNDESVRSVSLWYEDPDVEYAKGKHAGLFGFALLVSVFFVIPYTLFLLCHPVLEKYLSHFKLFKSWSRFKPIIDAYSGPMKDQYRFWPGLLLLSHIKCNDALTKKLFKKQDKDESYKSVDQQMREIVPTSTEVRLSNSRGSVVDLSDMRFNSSLYFVMTFH